MSKKYVTVHAHFYQPPRENGWTEEIEQQKSARPFHDWNERILFECYRPNSCARVVSHRGKIIRILNNYEWISFNFGPTLIDWLKEAAPLIYQRIIAADVLSRERWGRGNAIAQVYNHVVMPLANERDKDTQIRWGKANFMHHFGREPEGMWLAETAVDAATVDHLIENNVRFIILAPHQAGRMHKIGDEEWQPVDGSPLDISRPYRIFGKGTDGKRDDSRFLDVFFYHGGVSHDISFGDMLSNSLRFCRAFVTAASSMTGPSPLISVATDGEVYGHHRKFGDMTLAHALYRDFAENDLELTNFGAYLEKQPPAHEVEISEGPHGRGTSWSCAHGVGRWHEDCGCHTGGKPGWDQKWRTPLRKGLDDLRDRLAGIFEEYGSRYLIDPWRARDNYIRVIMDRSPHRIDRFFDEEGKPGMDRRERIQAFKLLEMQRHAMLMYTSCAWFFSDISGIETVQVLQYADRAMELASSFSGTDLETPFLKTLSKAASNLKSEKNGKSIFMHRVRRSRVTPELVVHETAVFSLFPELAVSEGRMHNHNVRVLDYDRRDGVNSVLAAGRVQIASRIIPEETVFSFVLLSHGGHHVRTVVREDGGEEAYRSLLKRLFPAFNRRPETIASVIEGVFGRSWYGLDDLHPDAKEDYLRRLVEKGVEDYAEVVGKLFDEVKAAGRPMMKEGMAAPKELTAVARIVLPRRLDHAMQRLAERPHDPLVYGELRSLAEEARWCRCDLTAGHLAQRFSSLVEAFTAEVCRRPHVAVCRRTTALLALAADMHLQLNLTESQNLLYELLRRPVEESPQDENPGRGEFGPSFSSCLLELAEKMGFDTSDGERENEKIGGWNGSS